MATEYELGGAPILIGSLDDATVRLAAGELSRYLYLLTGRENALRSKSDNDFAIELDQDTRLPEQAFRIEVKQRGKAPHLVIMGADAVGVLYGVYALLESLGVGFYNGGDTLPDGQGPIVVTPEFELEGAPAFAVRGNMLHYNFLCGPTNWGLADYRFYFDQLARQRMNLLLMHWYDQEPGAAYAIDGEFLAGGRTPNSLSKPWGALASLRTSEFSFGVGRWFDEEVWTSPAGDDLPDRITEIKQTEAMFRAATAYANVRGVRVAAGFEAPNGADPTDEEVQSRFQARLQQFLARNPDLTYFALWQHESGGCTGNKPPSPQSAAAELLESQRSYFEHCGTEYRVWEAVRFGAFAQLAADYLAEHAPHLRLVVVGWGGDRWMRFADYCLGYDKLLPKSVIFTCHDNIDASMGPNVSTPWGELPAERERWAMPWVEGDTNDCWTRQPQVEALGLLAPDALEKGCQGLLNLQWRTRDIEEENNFIARFAWDPELDPEQFYMVTARNWFGPEREEKFGSILGTLQRARARWDGVQGTAECSGMRWTGWEPHFPFELDSDAVRFLVPRAEEAAQVLAQVPAGDEDPQGAAFHLREKSALTEGVDTTRLGVKEMESVAERLRELTLETDTEALRKALWELHETVYALRFELLTEGMVGAGYRAIDGFLFPLHHLLLVAGYSEKTRQLLEIREELTRTRHELKTEGRIGRLERLDYLANTIDLVTNFDAVATMLADGEMMEQTLQACSVAGPAEAARLAHNAYAQLIEAGMMDALVAQTRKLTTRCDWGVLATLCVKPMPKYWEVIGRLEQYLPAIPPRELQGRGLQDEIWLSWDLHAKTAGLNLYRGADDGQWTLVNSKPLSGNTTMYIDRPAPGRYTYAVTALTADGVEGPPSHPITVQSGDLEGGPRIVACKPYTQLIAGEPYQQRVVVRSEREIATVTLVYRVARDGEWWGVPMHHRFRDSYQAIIPGEDVEPGLLEFYVQAEDEDGHESVWPQTAPIGVPWLMTVVDTPEA